MPGEDPTPAEGGIDPAATERADESGERSTAPQAPAYAPPVPPTYAPPGPPTYAPPAPVYAPLQPSATPPVYGAGFAPGVPPNYAAPAVPQDAYATGDAPYAQYAPQTAPYGYVPVSGRKFWALTFLFFIPYLGFLVSPIVAISLYVGGKDSPYEVVRGNARWAANWALTVLGCQLLAFFVVFTAAIIGSQVSIADGDDTPYIALAFCGLTLLVLAGLAHLIIAIIGTVHSGAKVFDPRIAIPFFGARR